MWGFLLLVPLAFAADETTHRCYRLSEEQPAKIAGSPYLLCMSSRDLEKFPKSVVTVTMLEERKAIAANVPASEGLGLQRAIASEMPASPLKPKLLLKRYLTQLGPNRFGRRSDPDRTVLEFHPRKSTVYVGFASRDGKSYFYKEEARP